MSKHLVVGASGTLGQTLMAELQRRGHEPLAASRNSPDCPMDLRECHQTGALLDRMRPTVIWNAAAIVGLTACEDDPGLAYQVNARGVAVLAEAAARTGARLVQVSTDHFFVGDGDASHAEDAPVRLLNEYARTKFAGERFALNLPGALVLRTNITGFRQLPAEPTFVEWVLRAIEEDAPVRLFTDFYTSTLDAASFARAACDLVDTGTAGLFNLASSEVCNKKRFVQNMAARLGKTLSRASDGSVSELQPTRANSLGLDVSKAEAKLGYGLPDLNTVVDNLVSEYRGLQ